MNERTLFDGEAESMLHEDENGKAIALYIYARDRDYYPASWKFKAGLNPLFIHLESPRPSQAKHALFARGFSFCGED